MKGDREGYSGGFLLALKPFLNFCRMAVYLGAGDNVACSISSPELIVMLGDLESGKICVGIALRCPESKKLIVPVIAA